MESAPQPLPPPHTPAQLASTPASSRSALRLQERLVLWANLGHEVGLRLVLLLRDMTRA